MSTKTTPLIDALAKATGSTAAALWKRYKDGPSVDGSAPSVATWDYPVAVSSKHAIRLGPKRTLTLCLCKDDETGLESCVAENDEDHESLYKNDDCLRLDLLIVIGAAPGITDTVLPGIMHGAETARKGLRFGTALAQPPTLDRVKSSVTMMLHRMEKDDLIEVTRFVHGCSQIPSYRLTPKGEALKQLLLRR